MSWEKAQQTKPVTHDLVVPGAVLEWRGSRFFVDEVIELGGGYRQCILRFADEPDRLPQSVPITDLVGAVVVDLPTA